MYLKEEIKNFAEKKEKEIKKKFEKFLPETVKIFEKHSIDRVGIQKKIILMDYGYIETINIELFTGNEFKASVVVYKNIDFDPDVLVYYQKNNLGDELLEIFRKKGKEDLEDFLIDFLKKITEFPDYKIYEKLNLVIEYK